MSDDQLDSTEAGFFSEIAGNLYNMDKHADGGEKSGLKSKHTQELIKKLGSSGGQPPRRPSPSIPEIPEIPSGSGLEPIPITEDMMNEADVGHMPDIRNPHDQAQGEQIPFNPNQFVKTVEDVSNSVRPDPNQMELGFDVVKAEDVYNEITDLTRQVRLLRDELREIKRCLTQSE